MLNCSCTIRFQLPETPSEWSLYASAEGVGEAASKLSDALRTAFDRLVTTDEMDVEDAMNEWMYPLLNKYSKFGALDAEVRDTCILFLTKAQKLRLIAKEACL